MTELSTHDLITAYNRVGNELRDCPVENSAVQEKLKLVLAAIGELQTTVLIVKIELENEKLRSDIQRNDAFLKRLRTGKGD